MVWLFWIILDCTCKPFFLILGGWLLLSSAPVCNDYYIREWNLFQKAQFSFQKYHKRVVQISQVLIYTEIYDSTNGLYEADI